MCTCTSVRPPNDPCDYCKHKAMALIGHEIGKSILIYLDRELLLDKQQGITGSIYIVKPTSKQAYEKLAQFKPFMIDK